MPDNAKQILKDVLAQNNQAFAPELSDQDYFEIFCAEHILKDFDLTYEELESGVVDGEHDGGMDCIYDFVNKELIRDDFDGSEIRGDVDIELHILQCKTSGGFNEAPLNRLISATRHLLKLDSDYDSLTQYNDSVKGALDAFRQVYRGLAGKFPNLKICYHYVAKSAGIRTQRNVQLKAEELKNTVRELFPDVEVDVFFLGARHLLDLARRRPKTTHELRVSRHLSDPGGYIALSPIQEYVNFLKDQDGRVQSELFESNVRDFQGNTEVNAEIKKTLRDDTEVDFWWMNNGITIIASRATLTGDTVTMESPQIVNGVQTSTQIARNFVAGQDEHRNIMVKIVCSEHEETRDKIIKATNSQNAIQPATLRATDKIQRDIEDALSSVGLFYDRRKNFYKNEGKPVKRIISIPLMAQSIMTIVLQRPDSARARPASLIKRDKDYSKVFSPHYPIGLYANAAVLIRRIESVLKGRSEMSAKDRNNLRFFVLFWLTASLANDPQPTPQGVAELDVENVYDGEIETAIDEVWKLYESLGKSDQVAKGRELVNATIFAVSKRVKDPKRHVGD